MDMVSMKSLLGETGGDDYVYPATRFVTDFTQLIVDVDRLMLDIHSPGEKNGHAKPNGRARKPTLNDTILTLREHAQSFLKSIRQSQALHDRVPVPYMELDRKARILRTNEECAQMLNGGTRVVGKSLFAFVANTDVEALRKHLATARETDKPSVMHISLMHKGRRCPVEIRIRRQPLGDDAGYLAVVLERDPSRNPSLPVFPRKRTAPSFEDLVANLSRARTLASVAQIVGVYCSKAYASPAGMIFVERDGHLQIVSQWRSRLVSKKCLAEERIRKGPATDAFRTGDIVFWRQTRTSRSNISRYLRRLLPGRNNRSVVFLPISASGQPPVGVLAIVLIHRGESTRELHEDMTRLGQIAAGSIARARAYDEALAARLQAEKANQQKEEFLSMLSHELKNPLTPILGWAVALSSGSLPPDRQSVAIDGIVRNVRALNYLIDDLLDVARISSGKLNLELQEMRLQEVVREALTAVQQMAENKRLRISTDISEAIPPFFADSRRVRQVLINLLNNA